MEPSNNLERKLILAVADPANRPEFYTMLLASDVYVMGFTEPDGEGARTLPPGSKISVAKWEKKDEAKTPVIPFFTSLETLRRAMQTETKYVTLSAKGFFEMTLGTQLTLNPASLPFGMEFSPEEIRALLKTGVNRVPQTRTISKEAKMQFGQPADHPKKMVSALATLLGKHSMVKAAYLCQMKDSSTQDKPSLVVGIEGEGDLSRVIKAAGSVAADTAPKGGAVDIIVIEKGKAGVSEYMFASVKPFYERSLGKKLRSWFK